MLCTSVLSLSVVPRAAVSASDASRALPRSGIPLTCLPKKSPRPLGVSSRKGVTSLCMLAVGDGERGSDAAAATTKTTTRRRIAIGSVVASTAAAMAAVTIPRRAEAADAGDWSSPGLNVTDVEPANYLKSPLGVVFEKINDGVGSPAKPGDVAVFHWILRRANGYFIYGSIDCGIGCGNGDPSEFRLGPEGKLIAGLDELLTGMQPGEKRRALIPPSAGYVSKGMEPQPPEFGQKRQVEVHAGEPLVFEVKLIKVRSAA